MADLIKQIFCANEQIATPHKGEVDGNGEFVFTCQNEGCGRFIKFPSDVTPEQFNQLLDLHEQHNTGQVSVEVQNKKLEALLGALEAPVGTSEQPTESAQDAQSVENTEA